MHCNARCCVSLELLHEKSATRQWTGLTQLGGCEWRHVTGFATAVCRRNRKLIYTLAGHYESQQEGLQNVALQEKYTTFFGLHRNACRGALHCVSLEMAFSWANQVRFPPRWMPVISAVRKAIWSSHNFKRARTSLQMKDPTRLNGVFINRYWTRSMLFHIKISPSPSY